MKKSEEIEKFIINKININEYKVNEKIPNELFFKKNFDSSKMTVRNVIEKLKNREILYSVRGSGVYVSPFNFINANLNFSKFDSGKVDFNKISFFFTKLKFQLKQIELFNRKYNLNLNFNDSNLISYLKFYYDKNEKIVAFSFVWINQKFITSKDKNILNKNIEKNISLKILKVLEENTIVDKNNFDKRIFNFREDETKCVLSKRIFLSKLDQNEIIMFEMFKKDIKDFSILNIKYIL